MISLIIIFICFILFLFFLYYLGKDDFVMVRKDISLDRIFNIAILSGFFSLFIARLAYIIFNLKSEFINPIVFFAIPYFPGLSLLGGLVGGSIFTIFYANSRKIPSGRLFDLMIMSLIGVMPIGLILEVLIKNKFNNIFNIVLLICSICLLLIFNKLIFPYASKGEIKDGTLGLIFFLIMSFIYFLATLFINIKIFSFLSIENIFILLIFFTSIILIINQEVLNRYLIKK